MKILILANSGIGLYKFRRELIQELIKLNHKVFVSLPNDEYVDLLKNLGCFYIESKVDRRGTNPIKDLNLLYSYINIIKNIQPDIIFTYTVKPNVYGGLAARIRKVPYICNVTGLGSGYLNGGIVQKVVQIFSKLAFKKAKKVFFQNTADRDLLLEQNVVGNNYDLLPGSGVNLKKYKVLPYPQEDQPINFNFVARIMKDKGIDEYLEAAKIIKSKYPDVTFNVIGMIDQLSYKEILKKYEEEGVIKYHGFQTDIMPFIEKCSCIINPSYTEGMSNVLLENAACGRPLIASNIPGCKEIIEEGKNGYTFNTKDIESLVKQIEKFINISYEEKIRLGLNGRKKVEREFDRQIVIQAYLKEIK